MNLFKQKYIDLAHLYTDERYDKREYKLMEGWYDTYLNTQPSTPVIPNIIHQIWVGGKPIPEEFKAYMQTWIDKHPDWTYMLWTDEYIKNIRSVNQGIYRKMTNVGAKSDYIRYAVLYDFGGLYVDTDFECLKPHDDLLWLNLFSSVADDKIPSIYVGHLGSVKGHPIIKACLDNIKNFDDRSNKQILNTTSVYFFTDNLFRLAPKEWDKTVIFPLEYFYPFPGNQRADKRRDYRLSFCTENTYAIHHWGTSWT